MINLFKRILFALYCLLLEVEWNPVRKVNYKYGQRVVKNLGRARYSYHGLKLYLNPLNMIDKQLIINNRYDPEIEDLIQRTQWSGENFIDIGANIGIYSLLAAKNGAVVYAFEPVSRELNLLYKHILENNFTDRIHAFPIGLSDFKNEAEIYLGPDRNTGANSMLIEHNGEKELRIFNRMDNILPEDVIKRTKVVKIDVEGYEYHVLEGMRGLMPHFAEAIFIVEITPKFLARLNLDPASIYDFFSEYGFTSRYGMKEAVQYDEIFSKKDLHAGS